MHFLSKLHSNSILTGSLDSYCLVCDTYLRTEYEAFIHMEKPIHRKNKGLAVIVDKFPDDRIVKVKKGYYCPFCNILLSTITRVNIHISDPNHTDNKRSQITRIGNTVVAFDEVAITLDTWHGITDNTCVVCNVEFDEDDGHSMDHTHILKLIQNKCEFGNRFIYRKVDEDSFFCLICGRVFAINEKIDHHESSGHKHFYNTAKDLKRKIPPVDQTEIKDILKNMPFKTENNNISNKENDEISNIGTKVAVNNGFDFNKTEKQNTVAKQITQTNTELKKIENLEVKKSVDDSKLLDMYNAKQSVLEDKSREMSNINNIQKKPETNVVTVNSMNVKKAANIEPVEYNSNILDRVEEFQKKGINIDFTSEIARCKKCYENLLFDTVAIEKHIEQHNPTKIGNGIVNDSQNAVNTIEKQTKKSENTHDILLKKEVKQTDEEPMKMVKQIDDKSTKVVIPKDKQKNAKKTKKLDNINGKKATKVVEDKQAKQEEANGKVNKLGNTKNVANRQQADKGNFKIENELNKDIENPKKVADTIPDTNNLAEFAKAHQMVILPNEAFCPLCKVSTKSNIEAITEHCNLKTHKENTKNESPLGLKISLEYLESLIRMESAFGTEVILNERHVLRQNSFHCIVMDDDKEENFTCLLCKVRVRVGQEMVEHMNAVDHSNKLSLTQVVTSLPEEFVREINPNTYHCGFCNEVCHDWPSMGNHLSSILHGYVNRQAKLTLERCHSIMKNVKTLEVNSMRSIHYA